MNTLKIDPTISIGNVLTGRDQGVAFRHLIVDQLRDVDVVEVDWCRVRVISPSFADEVVAKLNDQVVAGSVRFIDIPDHLDSLFRLVLAHPDR